MTRVALALTLATAILGQGGDIAAGRFAHQLPENAVILCNQRSGSLRYYANRITMRFEWLDADMYGEAIDHVRRLGRPVYVVLDDWERESSGSGTWARPIARGSMNRRCCWRRGACTSTHSRRRRCARAPGYN